MATDFVTFSNVTFMFRLFIIKTFVFWQNKKATCFQMTFAHPRY